MLHTLYKVLISVEFINEQNHFELFKMAAILNISGTICLELLNIFENQSQKVKAILHSNDILNYFYIPIVSKCQLVKQL